MLYRHTDQHGYEILKGHRVLVMPEQRQGVVCLVEEVLPGSQSNRRGVGTFYVQHADDGSFASYPADALVVL